MVFAFTNPSARAFLNVPQQPTPNSYNNAAAAPWSLNVGGAGAGSVPAPDANNRLPSFTTSPSPLGLGPSLAPVWYAATGHAAQVGGQQTLAPSLPSAAAAGVNNPGVHVRALEGPHASVAPSIATAAAHRRAGEPPAPHATPGGTSGARWSRPASPVATDGSSATEAAQLTGLDARRAGARYGVIPAWATESGAQRGRSGRRPRTANQRRSPSRSPTRQRRDGSDELASAVPVRSRDGTHDAGERVEDARISDLIYFVTSTSVGTRRMLNRMEQQLVIVGNQQRQVQCVLNRIAVHGDMAVRARQEASESAEAIKEKLEAITMMLKEKLRDDDNDETDITEEDKAAWVLDVAVRWSPCLRVTVLTHNFSAAGPFLYLMCSSVRRLTRAYTSSSPVLSFPLFCPVCFASLASFEPFSTSSEGAGRVA